MTQPDTMKKRKKYTAKVRHRPIHCDSCLQLAKRFLSVSLSLKHCGDISDKWQPAGMVYIGRFCPDCVSKFKPFIARPGDTAHMDYLLRGGYGSEEPPPPEV